MSKTKVHFLLDHKLMAYRLPFFEQLSSRGYNITVIHSGPILDNVDYIKQTISKPISFPGGIQYRKYKKGKRVDIVVHMQNIRILNLWFLTLNPFQKCKIVHWGIGTSSTQGLSLNKTLYSKARSFISKYADAIILYSDFPISLFPNKIKNKIFIANNTVDNPNMIDFSSQEKTSFLFIGTLNKRKGLEDLIIAFSDLIKKNKINDIHLNIIGDGKEKDNLIELAKLHSIESRVNFLGQITSSKEKEVYFKKAIASISPKQAGLSVLESFSYGVPFLAYKDAISGGEHLNIKSGTNGYLLNDKEELTSTMKEILENTTLSKQLGKNAFNYYKEKRQMKHMVNTFDSAFKYVLKKENGYI